MNLHRSTRWPRSSPTVWRPSLSCSWWAVRPAREQRLRRGRVELPVHLGGPRNGPPVYERILPLVRGQRFGQRAACESDARQQLDPGAPATAFLVRRRSIRERRAHPLVLSLEPVLPILPLGTAELFPDLECPLRDPLLREIACCIKGSAHHLRYGRHALPSHRRSEALGSRKTLSQCVVVRSMKFHESPQPRRCAQTSQRQRHE